MIDTKTSMQIYADLMDEARVRLDALNTAIMGRNTWAPRILQEFCYLQLRMLCEQVALGCLIAHGDIPNAAAFKDWRTPQVMKTMERLKPDFFPRGIKFNFQTRHGEPNDAPQLSKDELVALWNTCGNFLHRGTAKRLFMDHGTVFNVDLQVIIDWAQKLINLLGQHQITSSDGKSLWLVVLSHVESKGRSSIWLAVSP